MKMLTKDEAIGMLERIISDREGLPKDFNDQRTNLSPWEVGVVPPEFVFKEFLEQDRTRLRKSRANSNPSRSKAMRIAGTTS